MSNQISLTIPNDDPIALRAFGNALEEMAVAHGASLRLRTSIDPSVFKGQTSTIQQLEDTDQELITALNRNNADDITDADDDDTVGTDDDVAPPAQPSPDIDADGLPWDARIHSGNQERNADNTWRARRKPKDVTPEQWAEQVAQVRDELFALMAIPVVVGLDLGAEGGDYSVEVPVSDHESPAAVFGAVPPTHESIPVAELVAVSDSPVVVEQISGGVSVGFVTTIEPLPPITDPVPPAPAPLPPVAATGAIPTTMAEFMTSLTKYGPKDPSNKDECAAHVARVNEIVARHGLVSVGQLAKRLDLIPQVYADLVKELGV